MSKFTPLIAAAALLSTSPALAFRKDTSLDGPAAPQSGRVAKQEKLSPDGLLKIVQGAVQDIRKNGPFIMISETEKAGLSPVISQFESYFNLEDGSSRSRIWVNSIQDQYGDANGFYTGPQGGNPHGMAVEITKENYAAKPELSSFDNTLNNSAMKRELQSRGNFTFANTLDNWLAPLHDKIAEKTSGKELEAGPATNLSQIKQRASSMETLQKSIEKSLKDSGLQIKNTYAHDVADSSVLDITLKSGVMLGLEFNKATGKLTEISAVVRGDDCRTGVSDAMKAQNAIIGLVQKGQVGLIPERGASLEAAPVNSNLSM